MRKPRLSLKILSKAFFFLTLSAHAASSFEVIRLKSVSSEDVLPTLQGTFSDSLKITGMQNKLFVRGDQKSISELKTLLRTLDRKGRMLTLTIDDGLESTSSGSNIDVRLPHDKPVRVTGAAGDTRLRSSGKRTIQVLEGSVAEIGSASGVRSDGLPSGSGGSMQVRARLAGEDGVVVEVLSGSHTTVAGTPVGGGQPVTSGSQVRSTVRARRGEWITIGGVEASNESRSRYLVGKSGSESASTGSVRLRVD